MYVFFIFCCLNILLCINVIVYCHPTTVFYSINLYDVNLCFRKRFLKLTFLTVK